MTKNIHSIQKVFLEIDTPSMVVANTIKDNLAMFLQNELVPILEKQFNLIENTDNQIVQIEKLAISIDTNTSKTDVFFSNNETKNDLKNQIEKEIQKVLSEFKKSAKELKINPEFHTISAADKDIKTLLYFIENGSMPWWISKGDEVAFFDRIAPENLKKEVFSIPFRKLMQLKKVQKRVVNQFSNQEIALFVAVLAGSEIPQKGLSENNLLQLIHQKEQHFKISFWHLIFDFLMEKKPISLITFYHQEEPYFSSNKISFEIFIEKIKAFMKVDFTNEKLKKMNASYLVSEEKKAIIKPDALEANKDEIITKGIEKKQFYTDLNKEQNLNQNTPESTIKNLSEKEKSIQNSERKEPLYTDEQLSELKIKINSEKEELINNPEKNEPHFSNEKQSESITKINSEKEDFTNNTERKEQSYTDENLSESLIEIPSINTESLIEKEDEDDFQEEETPLKSGYVQNAGLILLHPFLKELLKSCDLIQDNKILNKELAAHILHYAATKKEKDYEHVMLFEKFLCGIPMQQSIRREITIEDKHKQQVEEMLLSVVEHWSALKNTSTAVLRTEFLQREGKLDWSESNPKLTIERKTQDLLLEKIPWNITIIKIPWIEKLIYTQW
ncbi:hypothetical protein GON26_09700 [Flavobacterium sp. GA093]|uniref:Uncharacterized protein n=1 Tax=Flavobacterium hydrocarbonoxydans TaxID=2683249 RepID=A0A6I4NU57_9FLAO|nr:contractile injection system tape measure protein [Flavobacterium hydrocarbonoxydans]MWB94637.1 hypothetical protein [Flavobacterium hydrocarbonoxydans]